MGEVIFDLQEMLERKARERAGTATVADYEAQAERIRAQVRAAVANARVELAEERGQAQGRQEERTTWTMRMAFVCVAWLVITAVAFVAGFIVGAL